ncbi:hypothetical protein BDR07DRAFT_1528515 [Suillus spraguei]|nr:hypothetical protein BDR07DRAFT_1528515 [Suillus spraguei]
MTIGRLHAIQNWDTASTSSAESDDLPSLTDAEWENLEDSQYRLNPLWPQNISDSLPHELQPFLLSRPVHPQRPQDNQTNLTRHDQKDDCISGESSLFGSETAHSMSEETSLFEDEEDHKSSLFGNEEDHTEESSLFGDSDQTDHSINEASTPASLPQDRMSLPNVGFHLLWGSIMLGRPLMSGYSILQAALYLDAFSCRLQSPADSIILGYPLMLDYSILGASILVCSLVLSSSLPWAALSVDTDKPGASGTPMMSPSNLTYPYAINTAFPPSTQFYPSANASTAPPLTTSSFRHHAYIPRTEK